MGLNHLKYFKAIYFEKLCMQLFLGLKSEMHKVAMISVLLKSALVLA